MSMTPQESTAVGLLDVMNEHVVAEEFLLMSSCYVVQMAFFQYSLLYK